MLADEDALLEDFRGLFLGVDRYTSVVGGSADGDEGFRGLQLIANCLCAVGELSAVEDTWIAPRTDASLTGPAYTRQLQIETRIHELRSETSEEFVLAFHVDGTDDWKLAWSRDFTQNDAVEKLTDFVRQHLILDYY